ncbi:MAG: 4'-phosphopantetheinyl transferase family protein [Thermodesulfobacteriota bacterium]
MRAFPVFQEHWASWRELAGWPGHGQLAGVRLAELDAGGAFDSASTEAWLTDRERRRLAALTLPKRRREWLGGRLAAKGAASWLRGQPEAWPAIEIGADGNGRPVVAGCSSLSISHSGPLAAALAAEVPCGLDLQEPRTALLGVRSRFAAPEEETLLTALLPAMPELSRLALLWAAKEAARKLGLTSRPPGLLATRLQEARGKATPPSPLRLTLSCPVEGGRRELTMLAFMGHGLAWAVCLAPSME